MTLLSIILINMRDSPHPEMYVKYYRILLRIEMVRYTNVNNFSLYAQILKLLLLLLLLLFNCKWAFIRWQWYYSKTTDNTHYYNETTDK